MLTLPIETIIFDLDGTLRHSVPSADDVQFHLANKFGAGIHPELQNLGARWAHYYWAQSTELLADVEKYEKWGDDFWINYLYRYLIAITVPEDCATDLAPGLAALMQESYTPESRVYPCVPETLQTLKEADFTVGLVSNRSSSCHEECEELGLLQYFDFAYVAAEVEAWKPNPRIFDRALELTGSSPEQIIYMGDNYYADIMGAKNAGLQAALLDERCVFPEAECVVISRLGELVGILANGE